MNIIGYHTCSKQGQYSAVIRGMPFYAPNTYGRTQWLSPGYYFWTDSPIYAKKWEPKNRASGKVIGEFSIQLDQSPEAEELLDLVGNVYHQELFIGLINDLLDRLSVDKIEDVLISEVISFLRSEAESDPEIFPYIAIKAMDNREANKPKLELKFVPGSEAYSDLALPLLTPQQMCLFEKERANLLNIIEPTDYQTRFKSGER